MEINRATPPADCGRALNRASRQLTAADKLNVIEPLGVSLSQKALLSKESRRLRRNVEFDVGKNVTRCTRDVCSWGKTGVKRLVQRIQSS